MIFGVSLLGAIVFFALGTFLGPALLGMFRGARG